MDLSKYPIETRARAALRITADLYAKAQAGPSETPKYEARRIAFLKVRPAVVLTAERAIFRASSEALLAAAESANGQAPDEADPRQALIDALLRIAKVQDDEFAAECAAVDEGELAVQRLLEHAISKLSSKPERRPGIRLTSAPCDHGLVQGRMRFDSCADGPDPCLAAVRLVEAEVRAGLSGPRAPLPVPRDTPETETLAKDILSHDEPHHEQPTSYRQQRDQHAHP
jgi:hypothetical protein